MDLFLGIDLGSTTSKAVLIDRGARVIGKGLTNTRSNYDVAVEVARREALIDARLFLLSDAIRGRVPESTVAELRRGVLIEAALQRLADLAKRCQALAEESGAAQAEAIATIFRVMAADADHLFGPLAIDRSKFFRDSVGSRFFAEADAAARRLEIDFEAAAAAYDRAIVEMENSDDLPSFEALMTSALVRTSLDPAARNEIFRAMEAADSGPLRILDTVGTGYGRQRLPFPKEQIQSEILCHGLGAHFLFPRTRTVLDIGGQDTKAIQLDGDGLVSSFQMNDRCAAGCGRYLGYVADELSLGIHELGPLALQGTRAVRISSTCTVFAGIELREFLATGEKREDILLGLHQAIVMRAMSLVARSGGAFHELTFTGGVAKNEAIVQCVKGAMREHYGIDHINLNPDSIFTGALGAALFARRGAAS